MPAVQYSLKFWFIPLVESYPGYMPLMFKSLTTMLEAFRQYNTAEYVIPNPPSVVLFFTLSGTKSSEAEL